MDMGQVLFISFHVISARVKTKTLLLLQIGFLLYIGLNKNLSQFNFVAAKIVPFHYRVIEEAKAPHPSPNCLMWIRVNKYSFFFLLGKGICRGIKISISDQIMLFIQVRREAKSFLV